MTQQEIQIILDSNLSSEQKSKLLKTFLDSSVSVLQEGGNIEKPYKPNKLHPTASIEVGDKEFDVEIADNPEKRQEGLKNITYLDEDEGMLFIFDELTNTPFTMAETPIDLDICFFNEEGVVLEVHSVKAFTQQPVACSKDYQYVLEVNINSNIVPGDELDEEEFEFTDDEKEKVKHSKMLVLNSDGDVQMRLVGGERIVSMIKTRQLIKAALKAYKSDEDKDYRRVGKLILTELDAQDERTPEYVTKD